MNRHADPSEYDFEPSSDELAAMAYADGELHGEQLEGFKRRLAADPQLGRAVAQYQSLEVMARGMAPPEPADYEWQRLESEPGHQVGMRLGFLLILIGAMGLCALGAVQLLQSDMDPLQKTLACGLLIGGLILLACISRARWRTLPFDPYRNVKR